MSDLLPEPPKVFLCSGKVEALEWNAKYGLSYTPEYRQLERNITDECESRLRLSLGNQFKFAKLTRFWEGSVGFDIQVYVDAFSNASNEALKKSLETKRPGSSLNLTIQRVEEETTSVTTAWTPKTETFERWHLAVWIISGVVVLSLLIVVCILQVGITADQSINRGKECVECETVRPCGRAMISIHHRDITCINSSAYICSQEVRFESGSNFFTPSFFSGSYVIKIPAKTHATGLISSLILHLTSIEANQRA